MLHSTFYSLKIDQVKEMPENLTYEFADFFWAANHCSKCAKPPVLRRCRNPTQTGCLGSVLGLISYDSNAQNS